MTEIKYKLEFLSDWAVLTGDNTAGIDNKLLCDEQGFPYLPGKSLKGVFREAFEHITEIIDYEPDKKQQLRKLFGKSKEKNNEGYKEDGTLIFSNGVLEQGLIDELLELSELDRKFVLQEKAVVTPRITIDEYTGMTQDKSLAFIEFGRKGICFYFSIANRDNKSFTKEEKETLDYCCKFIKRIGALRTRGKGRCKITEVE